MTRTRVSVHASHLRKEEIVTNANEATIRLHLLIFLDVKARILFSHLCYDGV